MNFIKKHLKLLIFILICITIFLIFKANNHHNINYTVLGDNFALGKNSYGQIDYGYSDYIKDYLTESNKINKYIKSFATKDTSINSLYQDIIINKNIKINNKIYNLKQTLRESNILTISIGINDLIYQISISENLTSAEIERILKKIEVDFDKLIKEIKKYYMNEIYVIGYYNIYPDNKIYQQAIKQLNNIYKSNKNIIYIDIYDIFNDNPIYFPKIINYYPTREGYEAISLEIIRKMRKKLEK